MIRPHQPCSWGNKYCVNMTPACIGYCKHWQKYIKDLNEWKKWKAERVKEELYGNDNKEKR